MNNNINHNLKALTENPLVPFIVLLSTETRKELEREEIKIGRILKWY